VIWPDDGLCIVVTLASGRVGNNVIVK